ncbi:MhpC Predicted hydrolases or acyltransferases (alpha/beta hydrolase superfamily) [actinobacterium SCGC AAA044-D11]
MSILKLKDGRDFDYISNDSQSEVGILFHHGTPGECTGWQKWFSELAGIKAVAASRPGYGLSDRRRARTVASDIEDQSQLLEFLGINKFVSIGWSGGGPHAINMTRHPNCVGAITLAGVGEWGNKDLNFLEGMGPENHEEFGAALNGEADIENWMQKNYPGFANVQGSDLIESFGGLIGDADKRALTPEVAEVDAKSFRRALSKGCYGWLDDDLAFVQSFGFDLSQVTKPVLVWQGDDDFMVPRAHSEWLAKHIPTAKLNFVPGHGHISLGESYRSEIIEQALNLLA